MKIGKTKSIELLSCVYAFLLTLIFTALFVCAGLGFGVFNDRGIISNLNVSNYYNKVYQKLQERTSRDIEAAGFPQAVLEDSITLERVYITGKNYQEAILSDGEASVKTDKLRQTLDQNLRQYLKAKGVKVTDELTKKLDGLTETIVQDYTDAIELPLLQSIMEYRTNYLSTILYLVPILIVLDGILCFFLLRLYRYIHRGIRYIAYAMLSASLLISLSSGYLMITKPYLSITAQPEYYQNFLQTYLRWNITVFIYVGGMGMILAWVLMSLISYLKNRMKNN